VSTVTRRRRDAQPPSRRLSCHCRTPRVATTSSGMGGNHPGGKFVVVVTGKVVVVVSGKVVVVVVVVVAT